MARADARPPRDAACRHLIVNEGCAAGATQPHTHAQLFALDFVPSTIARERERFGAYATRTMGGNLLADLVQQEVRRRERVVAIDSEAVLLSSYAARTPYQLTLAPRAPRMRFEDDGPTGAALLHDALGRLGRARSARSRRWTSGSAPPPGAPITSAGGSTSCRGWSRSAGSSSAPACT